ncbi:MAG: hypothetical protein JSS07_02975 [Proteobacteria bacterium]|nr:hypothetical protein [Pseudomonadota bacterium]
MQKILVSVPDELAFRIRTAIPARQRSRIISKLIEQEVKRREDALYRAALALDANEGLSQEMKEWEQAFGNDGLENDIFDESIVPKTQEEQKAKKG